jgi:hypothetical protein
MYAPKPGASEDGLGHYIMEHGLGTLVNWQGRTVILTNNHWGDMLNDAETVEILDAAGSLLVELSLKDFKDLILYGDPGTLILSAPGELPAAVEDLQSNLNPAIGDVVTVARQDPTNRDRVGLLQARIAKIQMYQGLPVYKLAVLDHDLLIPGDSGGGIWLNGRLVGNNWARNPMLLNLHIFTQTSLAAPIPTSVPNGEAPIVMGTPEPISHASAAPVNGDLVQVEGK